MGSLRDALTRPCFLHQFKTFPSYLFFHPAPECISHRKNIFQIFTIIYSTFFCHIFAEINISVGSGEGGEQQGRGWQRLQPLLLQPMHRVGRRGPAGPRRVGGPGGAPRHPQSSDQLGTSDLGGKREKKELRWLGSSFFFSPRSSSSF